MSTSSAHETSVTNFHHAVPILRVRDLGASVEHYVHVLGFKLDWRGPTIGSVSRGPCTLMLCEGDQGHEGGWVWIGVGDAEALFHHYKAKGAHIRMSPTNYPWALEMHVEDLDGNVLRFGSDAREGAPFGEWLDMRGDRWRPLPDGGWARVQPR